MKDEKKKPSLATILIVEIAMFIIAITGIYWADIDVGFDGHRIIVSILTGCFAGAISYGSILMVARSNTSIGHSLRQLASQVRDLLPNFGFATIIIVSLAAAIGEETLFRVFIQDWLSTLTSPWIGIGIAAVLFGLAHASSRTYFVIGCAAGIAIGCTYALTRDVVLIMSWHFTYDFIALTVMTRMPEVMRREFPEGSA